MASKGQRITIVGGGIAGLSLGIGLLRRKIPVRLLEASEYPRHRVCGEFISGVGPEALQRLGVADLVEATEGLVSTGWYDRHGCIVKARLPLEARGVSRYRLDHQMALRFVEEGGVLEERSRFRESEKGAERVVLSTGRPVRKESEWIGLKAHFTDFPLRQDLEMQLGEGGYLGLSRVECGRVNACGLFRLREGLRVSRRTALGRYVRAIGLNELADRMDDGGMDPESCVGVSAFSFGYQLDEASPHLRLGDRGAIIPPFTGNGMSMAFESAEMALDPLVEFVRGRVRWDEMRRSYHVSLRKRFRSRLWVSRMFHPIMASRVGRGLVRGAVGVHCLPFDWLFRKTR